MNLEEAFEDLVERREVTLENSILMNPTALKSWNSRQSSYICRLITEKLLHLVPKEMITKDLLDGPKDDFESIILMVFARGLAPDLPSSLLTQGMLDCSRDAGSSCFHVAAQTKNFRHIPDEFVTEANLLKKDDFGHTVLHRLCAFDNLDNRILPFLTKQNIRQVNKEGESVFFTASFHGNLHLMAPNVPSVTDLLSKGRNGLTSLQIALRVRNQTQNLDRNIRAIQSFTHPSISASNPRLKLELEKSELGAEILEAWMGTERKRIAKLKSIAESFSRVPAVERQP